MRVLPILFAAACAVETPNGEHATPPAPTFAQDTYYTGLVPPYASPEDCLAANPGSPAQWQCTWELGFCEGGQAALREGDVIVIGEYRRDGADVAVNIQDHLSVELDTTTDRATGTLETWIPDTVGRWMTEDFDLSACPDDPTPVITP